MWPQKIFSLLSNSAYLTKLVERQTDRRSTHSNIPKENGFGNNSELSRHHNVTFLLLHIRLRNKIALVTIVSAGPCWTSWTMLNNAGPCWTMLLDQHVEPPALLHHAVGGILTTKQVATAVVHTILSNCERHVHCTIAK